jgi:protease I
MDRPLAGKTVAILVANGFEEIDMTEPQRALLGAGATLKLVSPEQGLVNGWHGKAWGHYFPVDTQISEALAADFDAVLVPGGKRGIEKLAQNPHTKRLLRGFVDGNKPVALVGDAPLLLVAAERAQGRTVAGNEEIRAQLEEAGAKVESTPENPIVIDRSLITATSEVDTGAFKDAVLKLFVEIAGNMQAAA